jgi:hypothetical protein
MMQHKPVGALMLVGISLVTLCGCPAPSPTPNGETLPEANNRINIGENNWIVEPASVDARAGAGALESFEIVNDTGEEIVPDLELSKSLFRVTSNSCLNGIKPGQSCVVRGEWLSSRANAPTLDVAVAKPGSAAAPKKRISVPLEAAAGSASPTARTVAPTPAPTPTGTSSPTTTSATATSTATGSATATATPTTSPTKAAAPAATGLSQR